MGSVRGDFTAVRVDVQSQRSIFDEAEFNGDFPKLPSVSRALDGQDLFQLPGLHCPDVHEETTNLVRISTEGVVDSCILQHGVSPSLLFAVELAVPPLLQSAAVSP